MKTMLVPIDFSAVTSRVMRFACRQATLTGSRMVLVHAVQVPIIIEPFGLAVEPMAQVLAADERGAIRAIQRLAASCRRRGCDVRTVCKVGDPASIVLAQAAKFRADLIVIGSHGHGAVYDVLVGSTAQGVLRRATCPVVVVPGRPKTRARARR